MDYPFASWSQLYAGLLEHFSTEFYDETYPELKKYINSYDGKWSEGSNPIYSMLQKFLEDGHDAQEGLDGFLNCVIEGHRYSFEFKDWFQSFLELFLAKGATMKLSILFEPRWKEDFEVESYSYNVRAMLLDSFSKIRDIKSDVLQYADWKTVKGDYWEDLLDSQEDFDTLRFKVLKYHSEFLQSFQ